MLSGHLLFNKQIVKTNRYDGENSSAYLESFESGVKIQSVYMYGDHVELMSCISNGPQERLDVIKFSLHKQQIVPKSKSKSKSKRIRVRVRVGFFICHNEPSQ